VGACGFVHGVIDKEVRNLAGNACALVGVLGFDHTHAPAVMLPFEEDVPVDQGWALGLHGFEAEVYSITTFIRDIRTLLQIR
jgi:hypothetical protein